MNGITEMGDAAKPAKKKWKTIYTALILILCIAAAVGLQYVVEFRRTLSAAKHEQIGGEENQLQTAIQAYYIEYDIMPDATNNAGLVKTLTGDNPRGIAFMSLSPLDQNSAGEMIDPWGTPFRVAIDRNSKIHVISAGPDKIFGTMDDITNN